MGAAPLPLTYADAVCGLDVDALGRETGSDLETLVQDVFHQLYELQGSNPDDPDGGLGIETLLSGTDSALRNVAGRIDAVLQRDTRITTSRTTVTQNADGSFTIGISIQAGDAVIGASFSYAAEQGLTFLGNQGMT